MYPSMLERVASVIKNLEGCYDGCKHCNMIAKAAITEAEAQGYSHISYQNISNAMKEQLL